jgi:hypothetical protein
MQVDQQRCPAAGCSSLAAAGSPDCFVTKYSFVDRRTLSGYLIRQDIFK